ncbi:hypothetical protein ES703_95941 [subsurface metagenome]
MGRGLDDSLELAGTEGAVAGEFNFPDRRLGAFRDRIDEIDAAVAAVDDLGLDDDLVAAGPTINLDDAIGVGLNHSPLQRALRLGFDRRGKVGVLDLLVAFECNAGKHGRFSDAHDDRFTGAADRDALEQSGCDQRLQGGVTRSLVVTPAL